MPVRERPLSPHLSIYRWQIGNTLSILHRLTGVALSIGLVAFIYWLMSVAGGAQKYLTATRLFESLPGRLVLIGFTFAFLYHFLNGIRHLFWDLGLGFERTQRHVSGWLAVGGAVLLTLLVWLAIGRAHG